MVVYGNNKIDGTYTISQKFGFWPRGVPVYENSDKSKKLFLFWEHQLPGWKIEQLPYLGIYIYIDMSSS